MEVESVLAMIRVHLFESESSILRREVTVACGEKMILPIAACIFDEMLIGQSLDLAQIRGLCRECRKNWETGKSGRKYVYGLVARNDDASPL